MSEPTPLTITPSFSILAVTSPSESGPSVILLTEYNCSFELLLTIFSIALNVASTGPPPLDSLLKFLPFFSRTTSECGSELESLDDLMLIKL